MHVLALSAKVSCDKESGTAVYLYKFIERLWSACLCIGDKRHEDQSTISNRNTANDVVVVNVVVECWKWKRFWCGWLGFM